jgi:carboxyl-terminal processing protease
MKTRGLSAAAAVIVLSTVAGGLVGAQSGASQDRLNDRYEVYTKALAAVEREYVEPIEGSRLVYGSIDGMLRTLDPHSSFLEPKQYERMREQQSGRYYGIGITIVSADGQITVTLPPFEGSPAYRAGIRRNDIIARVGQPIPGKTPRTIAWEDTKAGRPRTSSSASRARRGRPLRSRFGVPAWTR